MGSRYAAALSTTAAPAFAHSCDPSRVVFLDWRQRRQRWRHSGLWHRLFCRRCWCLGPRLHSLAGHERVQFDLCYFVLTGCNAFHEPVRVPDPRHRIRHFLHGRGNRDELLDDTGKPLNVIVPVEDTSQVKVRERVVPQEATQKVSFHIRLSIENGHRHCTICNWGTMRLG